MQLVQKSVKRDDAGAIVGTTELVHDEKDLYRLAARTADGHVDQLGRSIRAHRGRDDDPRLLEMVEQAQSWATVGMVARRKLPGSLTIDADAVVTGCTLRDERPPLTLKFTDAGTAVSLTR